MSSGIDDRQAPWNDGTRERRCDRQPGLFFAANELCTTDMTNGFCSPKQQDVCKCWNRAEKIMEASGLSAQAVAWVYRHRQRIEQEAAKFYAQRDGDAGKP